MNDDWSRSYKRQLRIDESRGNKLGLAFSKRGEALTQKYYPQLANRIAAGRGVPRDKEIYRALRRFDPDLDNTNLAIQLLVAGIHVCDSKKLWPNDNSEKGFHRIAIWIGRNFGVREDDDELALKVGAWGINILLSLTAFALDGEILVLTSDARHLFDEVLAEAAINNPLLSPLQTAPAPWTQVSKGGLPDDHWARRPLVSDQPTQGVWRKAISTCQMQPVLDALNHLQSPAFVINKPVLAFMKRLGFPKRPPVSYDFKTDEDWRAALKEWEVLARSWALDMVTADAMAALDHFYVPLRLEFRGRVLPIPRFHYQRDDSIRGLFLFRDGELIGSHDRGLPWLWAYAGKLGDGNKWSGVAKPSRLRWMDRLRWTDANLKTIRQIGDGVLSGAPLSQLSPLIDGIDEPCQFLACCVEIAQQQLVGPDFITRLPILVDATNSALQHWGSMVRAPETKYANISPTQDGDDFYLRIAYDVHGSGEPGTELMRGNDDRGIVKGAIVAQSYGSRPGRMESKWIVRNSRRVKIRKPAGMTRGIMDTLKDRGALPEGAHHLMPKLASSITRRIKERAPLVEGAKKFIRAIAKLYATNGQHFHYTSRLGLRMINAYSVAKSTRVRVLFNGQWRRVKLAIGYTDEIDDEARKAAVRAAGANLIHSQDACHLQMVALEAAKENIELMTIHDCFGALATRTSRLFDISRAQFDELYKGTNIPADILEQAKRDLPKDVKLPPLPEMGEADISQVRLSHNAYR
jgi:DNA-directed RNA polymerase